jgi:hypothetical protein
VASAARLTGTLSTVTLPCVQVCLPGGKRDPVDVDDVACALVRKEGRKEGQGQQLHAPHLDAASYHVGKANLGAQQTRLSLNNCQGPGTCSRDIDGMVAAWMSPTALHRCRN